MLLKLFFKFLFTESLFPQKKYTLKDFFGYGVISLGLTLLILENANAFEKQIDAELSSYYKGHHLKILEAAQNFYFNEASYQDPTEILSYWLGGKGLKKKSSEVEAAQNPEDREKEDQLAFNFIIYHTFENGFREADKNSSGDNKNYFKTDTSLLDYYNTLLSLDNPNFSHTAWFVFWNRVSEYQRLQKFSTPPSQETLWKFLRNPLNYVELHEYSEIILPIIHNAFLTSQSLLQYIKKLPFEKILERISTYFQLKEFFPFSTGSKISIPRGNSSFTKIKMEGSQGIKKRDVKYKPIFLAGKILDVAGNGACYYETIRDEFLGSQNIKNSNATVTRKFIKDTISPHKIEPYVKHLLTEDLFKEIVADIKKKPNEQAFKSITTTKEFQNLWQAYSKDKTKNKGVIQPLLQLLSAPSNLDAYFNNFVMSNQQGANESNIAKIMGSILGWEVNEFMVVDSIKNQAYLKWIKSTFFNTPPNKKLNILHYGGHFERLTDLKIEFE